LIVLIRRALEKSTQTQGGLGAVSIGPEMTAFGPGFGVELTFLSGKMAKRSTNRNWSATAGNRDARSATREAEMPVELSHIGEDLIAEMLCSISQRQELHRVVCAVSGRSLAEDIREVGLGESPPFRAEDASLVVHDDAIAYACDGEQKVDVLCTGEDCS
jgi:hypothetical protein